MRPKSWLLTAFLACALLDCAHNVGESYLKSEQYDQGIRAFEKRLSENPDDPSINYYLGRFYLAEARAEQALAHLSRAVTLAPGDADNYFWLGVAHWAAMDFQAERRNYQEALALDKNHIPARLYLAHNLSDNGEWKEALVEYGKVLQRDRYNPEALYNRGLVLQQLGKPSAEVAAWRGYLKYYPDGKWALRAADHLNALGDFSYRNFAIGYRRVTLEPITFSPNSADLLLEGKPSLRVVGSILSINAGIELEILGYKKGDAALARARAEAVRDYLLEHFPSINPSRLEFRGQGQAETVGIGNSTYGLNESISFVTTKR
jgi:tetratricopeptide (TPR) repeat protein